MGTTAQRRQDGLRYRYSPTELKILRILRGRKSWVGTGQIVDHIYAGKKMPFHARIFINSSMRNLLRKAGTNKDVSIAVDRKDGELHYRIDTTAIARPTAPHPSTQS